MFKVVIVGGESTKDYDFFEKKCIQCLKNKVKTDTVMIYSIGDSYVERFSKRFGIDVRFFVSKFKRKTSALNRRNEEMLADADALIAFNDKLKTTSTIIEKSNEKKIPSRIIEFTNSVSRKPTALVVGGIETTLQIY